MRIKSESESKRERERTCEERVLELGVVVLRERGAESGLRPEEDEKGEEDARGEWCRSRRRGRICARRRRELLVSARPRARERKPDKISPATTHPCTLPTMWLRLRYCMPLYSATSWCWLLSPFVRIHCSVELGLVAFGAGRGQLTVSSLQEGEGERDALVVRLDDAVHDRDGRARDLVDGDVAVLERGVPGHVEEQEVASLWGDERREWRRERDRAGRESALCRGGTSEKARDGPGWPAPCSRCRQRRRVSGRSLGAAVGAKRKKGTDLRTTTTGLSVLHKTERPFHIMRAVESTMAKLRAWVRTWCGTRVRVVRADDGEGRRG